MSKNESLNKTGPSQDENFVRSDNPGQTIWNKIDKSSKTREEKKSLKSTFACFLLLLPKFIFCKRDLRLRYVSTLISHFPNICLFPKILSLKSLGKSWGNSDTKFAIVL